MQMLQINPTLVTLRGRGGGIIRDTLNKFWHPKEAVRVFPQLQLAWTTNGQVIESTEFKQCFVKANGE